MEHTNIVSSPLVGISGGKLDKEVIKKAVKNLVLTPANKRRLKKLEALHGAGFWSDFGTGFTDTLDVAGKVADVGVKLDPLAPLLMAGAKPDLEKAKESLKKYVNRERKTRLARPPLPPSSYQPSSCPSFSLPRPIPNPPPRPRAPSRFDLWSKERLVGSL